ARAGRSQPVELFLLDDELLPAGVAAGRKSAGDLFAGFAGQIVVVQVLVGEGAQGAQPRRAEQSAFFERGQRGLVGEQVGEPVAAVGVQAAQPSEVVEARVVEVD